MVMLNSGSDSFVVVTNEIKFIVLFAPVLKDDGVFVSFAIEADSREKNWASLYRLTWSVESIDAEELEHFDKKPENVGFYEKGTEAVVLFKYSALKEYEYIYSSSQ